MQFPIRNQFALGQDYLALNHGSFGSTPQCVLDHQTRIRTQIEMNPDLFFRSGYFEALDEALLPAAKLLNLSTVKNVVFAANATAGVNAALRSLKKILKTRGRFPRRKEIKAQKILYFSTVYGPVGNAITRICENDGFEPLCIHLRLPMSDQDLVQLVHTTLLEQEQRGNEIVMAVYDAVSSVPGIICPFTELTRLFQSRNVLTCIDGAHAIGQIPVDLNDLKPDFFSTNLHKWLFVPRGCCLFYCDEKFHGEIGHAIVSDVRANDWRVGFHWVGTQDVSNYLCTPKAIEFRESLGGEEAIMRYNHALAKRGGEIVAKKLGTYVMRGVGVGEKSFGDNYYAAMVNVAVPKTRWIESNAGESYLERLMLSLLKEHNTGVVFYKHADRWWVRMSAQVYLDERDFEKLGDLLYSVIFGPSSNARL